MSSPVHMSAPNYHYLYLNTGSQHDSYFKVKIRLLGLILQILKLFYSGAPLNRSDSIALFLRLPLWAEMTCLVSETAPMARNDIKSLSLGHVLR